MKRVVIAGGGLAGSALAIRLARAGLAVTICERERFPRDKLCGELLSPESERELRELDVLDEVLALSPARIPRYRFTAPSGATLEGRLPGDALGISRWALDALLFSKARRAGADAREGVEVAAIGSSGDRFDVELAGGEHLEADLAISAHGKRSKLDKTLGRAFISTKSAFVGIKRHFRAQTRIAELEGCVEIHAFEGGYCGLAEIEGGAINACALIERRVLGSTSEGGDAWDRLASVMKDRSAILGDRLSKLIPADDRVLAIAQISFGSKERSKNGIMFIGDAAGLIAPLAGDGQASALASARVAAELILTSPTATPRVLAERWNRAFLIHFSRRIHVAGAIQKLLLDARAAGATIRLVRTIPGLAPLIVRLTRSD